MKNNFLVLIAIIIFVNACSAPNEPTPAPLQNATAPLALTVAPINTRTDRRAPTLAPPATATEIPSATALPTSTVALTTTPTLAAAFTPSPTRTRLIAPPTPTLEPKVYVTAFSIDPPAPKSKPAQFLFRVKFLNTVGDVVNYPRWRVLIMPKGQTKAVGDPQGASKQIVNGASEQNTEAWSIKTAVGCESFIAQPVWEDENAKQTPFPKPAGKNIVLEFQVCP